MKLSGVSALDFEESWQAFAANHAVIADPKIKRLFYQESIWRHAADLGNQGVWDYNAITDEHYTSPGWRRMRGLDPDVPFHDNLQSWLGRIHPEDLELVKREVAAQSSGASKQYSFEYREKRADGEWVWILAQGKVVEFDATGKVLRLVGTDFDITNIKKAEAERAHHVEEAHSKHIVEVERARLEVENAWANANKLSLIDPLSGLANRRAFTAELDRLVNLPNAEFSVMLIDLDFFKQINDRHGHSGGDKVIVEVSRRLNIAAAKCAMVARLGGDEFGLITHDPSDQDFCETESLLQKLEVAFAPQFELNKQIIPLPCSIGISRFPEHAETCSELLSRADFALYEAKERGRNQSIEFDNVIGQKAAREALLVNDIRSAIANQQIVPYFQPIVNLKNGRTVRMEVLARWQHPTLGIVAPDEFVGLARRLGLSFALTSCVVGQALQHAAQWPSDVGLSVNLDAEEVCCMETATSFLVLLSEHKFDPIRMQIEITEQALMKDTQAASKVIAFFRKNGISVFLDDFGKGFSGLCYLRELVLDGIKIDGSFVNKLQPNTQGWKVLSGITDLARNLSLVAVVEGLESRMAAQYCLELGAKFGQGFAFARPLQSEAALLHLKLAESQKYHRQSQRLCGVDEKLYPAWTSPIQQTKSPHANQV